MLHNGRFPLVVHEVAEYLAGVLLIVAPFLLDFGGTATAVSIVAGVLVLVLAATTDWAPAVMRAIPLAAHSALDLAVAALLVAAPFIFGFTDDGAATGLFIALGVVHLLLTLGTRYIDTEPEQQRFSRAGTDERDVMAPAPPLELPSRPE